MTDTSGSSSPPRDHKEAAFDLPGVPAIAGSPNSSAPSTPTDENQGHKRSDSVAIGNEDYFMTALRLRQDNQSAPGTPRGTKRSATFSPRIVFYDTWPSQEYDRRGEIATCNRLTPMLAQQIKEELNTFKMVCRPPPRRSLFVIGQTLTSGTGNGGPRKLQDLHALLLTMAMPPKASRIWPSLNFFLFFLASDEGPLGPASCIQHLPFMRRSGQHSRVSGVLFLLSRFYARSHLGSEIREVLQPLSKGTVVGG